jgi:hypothetical protein
MIVEQTTSDSDQTVFDIQMLFNSSRNHEYECPFCSKKAQIILSTQLLVGDQSQVEYPMSIDQKK